MAALESGVTTTVVKPSVTLRVVRPGVPTLRLTTPTGPILHVVAPRAPQLVLPAPRRSTAILVPLPGPRGPAGGEPFVHRQARESAEWIVNHNRGRAAAIQVIVNGRVVGSPEIYHVDLNQARVRFAVPQVGTVLVE